MKYREIVSNQLSQSGVTIRNIELLRIPVSGGLSGLSIEAPCRKTWNAMPERIKLEKNRAKAFRMIKSWAAHR